MSFGGDKTKTVQMRNKQQRSSQFYRNSFIYRKEKNSTSEALIDPFMENIPNMPFTNILEKINQIKEKIASVRNMAEEGASDRPKRDEIVLILRRLELELEKCLENLISLPLDKSIREMASETFQKLLTNELSYIKYMQPNGFQVSQYISENFTDSGDRIPETNATSTQKMSRSRSFRTEIKFNNDLRIYHKQNKLTILPNIDKWGIDIFKIEEEFPNRVLTVMAYTAIVNRELDQKLNICHEKLTQFLVQLEEHYHPEVIYHNSTHAADVLQCVNVFLNFPCFEGIFSDCEILAAIIAASIHDVDHPGFSNQFLIRTNSDLTTTYNDISVLENHHVSTAFKLIKRKECDILSSLSKSEQVYVRKIIIEMVLGTDMSKHYDHVAQMMTIIQTNKADDSKPIKSDRINLLKSIIHCADISSSARPSPIYRKWVERVTNEFFIQGDLEKFLGYEPSPLCDRHNIDVVQSQTTFIDYVALPLWEAWAQIVYPSAEEMLASMQENKSNLGRIAFREDTIHYEQIIKEYGLQHCT